MPSCHLPFRSLLRSRSPVALSRAARPRPRWLAPSPKFSTASAGGRSDETTFRADLDFYQAPVDPIHDSIVLNIPNRAAVSPFEPPKTRLDENAVKTKGRVSNRPTRRVRSRLNWTLKSPQNQAAVATKPGIVPRNIKRPHILLRMGFWDREFGKLRKRYDPKFKTKIRSKGLDLDSRAEEWAKEILDEMEKDEARYTTNMDSSEDAPGPKTYGIPQPRWQNVALWLLDNEPDKMPLFLRCTHARPFPPSECIQNSLWYLSAHYLHASNACSQGKITALVDLFRFLARRENSGRQHHLRVWSGFFRNILKNEKSDERVALQLYQAVKAHSVKVSWNSLLHFTTYFARHGYFEQALDALLEAKSRSAVTDSYAFRSNCSTLLRSSIRQVGGLRVSLRIIDNLIDMGVTLDPQLCNIVMLNAVEAGDIKTAMSIYHSLVQHGLEADAYTFAILLKGCKMVIDDAELLNTIVRDAIAHVNVLTSPIVAAEILHCLALHHTKHNQEKALRIVADAFAQLFDTEPLDELGILPSNLSQPGHPGQQKLQCTPQAFGIMLAVCLEHLHITGKTRTLAHVYDRYRELADTGVDPFASTIENDYIPNAFMVCFIKKKQGLLRAAQVVKDMQKPNIGSTRQRCKPTVYTWSIFLHGFKVHKQPRLAEQVLSYMRSKNIEPNEVTWNTLTTAYAAAQDVEGAIDAVRRMEADGYTWDHWTVSGLRRLRDQRKFEAQLHRSRQSPQYDFTTDIKDELSTRLTEHEKIQQWTENRSGDISYADSPLDLAEKESDVVT